MDKANIPLFYKRKVCTGFFFLKSHMRFVSCCMRELGADSCDAPGEDRRRS